MDLSGFNFANLTCEVVEIGPYYLILPLVIFTKLKSLGNTKLSLSGVTGGFSNLPQWSLSVLSNPQKYQCDSMSLHEFFHHSAVVSCITFHV